MMGRMRLRKKHIISALFLGGIIALGLTMLIMQGSSGPYLPNEIAKQAAFTIYLPKELPGNYEIDKNSFTLSEGVLLFQATDSDGTKIVFSEQPRPNGFSFDDFYSNKLSEAKALNDVPFPSVTGRMDPAKGLVLSVVAHDTWLLANAPAVLSSSDLHIISKSLSAVE